jgi:hypothetical protein
MTKSLSGPSGRVINNKFVFDETRSRFVFPQDKSLVVYFEWQASVGDHTLVATWKAPDGRVVSISPDVKVQTKNENLNAYWQFLIAPGIASGVWTCEVKIDGSPAGSQAFELVVPALEPAPQPAPAQPEHPTMDEIYKKVTPSLVWVYAVDTDGTRLDTSDGFVYGPNLIATSFSAIDSAAHLEIEFANGRRVKTDEVQLCSRLGDWALLHVDTAGVPSLTFGNPSDVKVGDRLPVFNVQPNHVREFGGVDVTGRQIANKADSLIHFEASLTTESAGGPLLDLDGKVVGILGGSLTPGARFHHKDISMSPALFSGLGATRSAVPVTVLQHQPLPATPDTSSDLVAKKTFTRPLGPGPSFLWGGMSDKAPKNLNMPPPEFKSEFRRNENINVLMNWQKRDKNGKGMLGAEIFDASNKLLGTVAAKKVSLAEREATQLMFGFSPAPLTPGIYRIDVLWNDQAVWRTFFTVVE